MAYSRKLAPLAVAFATIALLVTPCAAQSSVQDDVVNLHNEARADVGVKPVSWNESLATYAESYAATRQDDCKLKLSGGPYGENLFWGSGAGWAPAQAVGAWLSERPRYDYWSNSCYGGMCGHYTQIMWRSTRRVGCAMVTCYNGRGTFITCNYDPPGNYVGVRPY